MTTEENTKLNTTSNKPDITKKMGLEEENLQKYDTLIDDV